MNTLVLRPRREALAYAAFQNAERRPSLEGKIVDYRGTGSERVAVIDALHRIRSAWAQTVPAGEAIDAIALRGTFGGSQFAAPTLAQSDIAEQIDALVPESPLHAPILLSIVRGCAEVFPGTPVVLVFETAFFASLPPREYFYGLDPDLTSHMSLRRFGYHGIYHEAACAHAHAQGRRRRNWRRGDPRILSICLEPRPEIAAVIGRRPVMVTSGVTPLEGLPGVRTCGELDPSIILTLVNDLGWGPEKINEVLTQESGLVGLLDGHAVHLDALFESDDPDLALARRLMEYRILLASGSAVAAMGGLDTIVFSGRYTAAANRLGPWLVESLTASRLDQGQKVEWMAFEESLDRILADQAAAAVKSHQETSPA